DRLPVRLREPDPRRARRRSVARRARHVRAAAAAPRRLSPAYQPTATPALMFHVAPEGGGQNTALESRYHAWYQRVAPLGIGSPSAAERAAMRVSPATG